MKNRIILHTVKKNKPIPKTIQKRPTMIRSQALSRKFYKNQLINMQTRTNTLRKITGVGPIIQNVPNRLPANEENNQTNNLKNNEIHSIFNKIITTLNNKMNNSEFTNDEDLLLTTYFEELTDLKKKILKI